jgi:hypothetical protein
MKTFRDHVNQKNVDIIASQIIEHLALQSEFFDPFDTLESVFVESYGQENAFLFAEAAFEGDKGILGNIGRGFRGAVDTAIGGLTRAAGGLAGGGYGGLIGGAKGMVGRSGDPESKSTLQGGAKAGFELGRGMFNRGLDSMRSSFANRGQAAMVSSYRKSIGALDSYIKAVQGLDNPELSKELLSLKDKLEQISSNVENHIKSKSGQAAPGQAAPAAAAAAAAAAPAPAPAPAAVRMSGGPGRDSFESVAGIKVRHGRSGR